MRRPALVRLFFAAVSAAALAGCGLWDRPFGDEYYDGHNFIASLDFSRFNGEKPGTAAADPAYIAPGAPGAWDWQWRGATGTSGYALAGSPGSLVAGDGEFPYMTLAPLSGAEAAAAGLPPGAPAGASAYRLAVANLLPGGDFESGMITGSTDPAKAQNVITNVTGVAINGQSLQMSISDSGNYVHYALAGLADRTVLPTGTPRKYDFSFMQKGPVYLLGYGSAYPFAEIAQVSAISSVENSFHPNQIELAASPVYFLVWELFNSVPFSDLVIDDLRACRTDIDSGLTLRLRRGDGSPTMVAGDYEFAVWVRDDPAASSQGDATVREPYDARSLTLVMYQPDDPADPGQKQVLGYAIFDRDDAGSGWAPAAAPAGGWRRLAIRFAPGSNFTFRESAADVVIELSVVPGASQNVVDEPGSILVAYPELLFFPDGY
jgi:hypothetical protein